VRVGDPHDVLKCAPGDQRNVHSVDVCQGIDGFASLRQHARVLGVILKGRESAIKVECHQDLGVNRKLSESFLEWLVAGKGSH
jgi:hypothetical protein